MSSSFTSIGRSTFTQGIILWLNRNDPVDTRNSTPADAWRNFLQRATSSSGGTEGKRDLEAIYLRQRIAALGGSSTNQTLADLWNNYLSLKGFTGSVNDMFAQWIDHGTP